ncbi:purine-cytosine permease family protein [Bacillus salipaludis]|uniref:purine-cytosine permease family protein n=1 Tax=Bacillus salipaludis TaxID=2547811 RepID=UPI002E24B5F9|nr:cytosine permease [Bacillus salipaludis]
MAEIIRPTNALDGDLSKEAKNDDFALEKVPLEGRTMSWISITNVTLGVATAMLFIQMGSLMATSFGAVNALLAEIYATLVAGGLGIGICFIAAKSGLNVNLLARGGGFGYLGASITSLIYALNFIMYCAIEGSIMASAVHEYLPFIPAWVLMVVFGLLVIPLNWFGIKQLDKLQKWSIPIFLILLGTAFVLALNMSPKFAGNVWTFIPKGASIGGASLLACIGIMNGLVGIMALLVSDYARFIKKDEFKIGVFAVGFIPQLVCFLIMGIIGIWFGVRMAEQNPGIYFVQILGIGGALFTILTQLRINVTNIYSGSLSLASFFENIFKFKPGRKFWVVFVSITAIILMLGGVINHVGSLLTFQGVFLLAWGAVLVCDAVVVKKLLKIGPNYFEHRQEYLFGWNPVGVVSLIVSCIIGSFAAFGYFGVFLQNIAAFFAAIIAFALTILLAIATKGKYYGKKKADDITLNEYIR